MIPASRADGSAPKAGQSFLFRLDTKLDGAQNTPIGTAALANGDMAHFERRPGSFSSRVTTDTPHRSPLDITTAHLEPLAKGLSPAPLARALVRYTAAPTRNPSPSLQTVGPIAALFG
ncbi:MAG: hypothetical protein ABJG15_00450 [Hyphomonadaceae bacterium]